MSRKHEAHNTITPGTVTVSDTDLQTLDSIIKHWNLAAPKDPPTWDAATVLAELARLQLVSMRSDYGDEPRKPTHATPPPRQDAPTPPLDSPTQGL